MFYYVPAPGDNENLRASDGTWEMWWRYYDIRTRRRRTRRVLENWNTSFADLRVNFLLARPRPIVRNVSFRGRPFSGGRRGVAINPRRNAARLALKNDFAWRGRGRTGREKRVHFGFRFRTRFMLKICVLYPFGVWRKHDWMSVSRGNLLVMIWLCVMHTFEHFFFFFCTI